MSTKGATKANGVGASTSKREQEESVALAPLLVQLNNLWLSDLTTRIRSRPIPWEGYARAELVSNDELRMIRSLDGESSHRASELLDEQGAHYATLFVRLLAKLTRTDTLQQVLVLIGDMLQGRDDRAGLFLQLQGGEGATQSWPWAPLVKLLDVQDDFTQVKAAQYLTILLVYPGSLSSSSSSPPSPPPPHVLSRLLSFISSLVNSGTPRQASSLGHSVSGATVLSPPSAQGGFAEGNGADIGIQLLEALLRSNKFRKLVWKDEVRKMGTLSSSSDETQDKDGEEGEGWNDDQEASQGQEQGEASVLAGLRNILRASALPSSISPFSSSSTSSSSSSTAISSSASSSGTSTPRDDGRQATSSSSGSRTPAGTIGVQIIYQVVFCLWLLSFDEEIAAQLNTKFGFVSILADVARNAVKEKVVRVIVATFRNLVDRAASVNASALLGSKGLSLMESLASRKWSDEEIPEDVEVVRAVLADRLKKMSTYDQFISELSSGRLTWDNPAHSLDDFWRDNATRLVNDNDAVAGEAPPFILLVKVLFESEEAQSLSVACNDIGKVVNFAEAGRKKVEASGAKARIMELMSHSDPDVKYRALATVSRLVSGSWRG